MITLLTSFLLCCYMFLSVYFLYCILVISFRGQLQCYFLRKNITSRMLNIFVVWFCHILNFTTLGIFFLTSVSLDRQEARSIIRTETMSVLFVSIFSPSQGYLGFQHLLKAKKEEEIIRESDREREK